MALLSHWRYMFESTSFKFPFQRMKIFIFISLVATAISSAPTAFAEVSMPSGYYLSVYGSDDALLKRQGGCFASAVFRSNQCIKGVNPVNKFAVEYRGKIYCHKVLAPVVDRPLKDAYDRNSSIESICSIRGWIHSRD
jgi:hypothetical protein